MNQKLLLLIIKLFQLLTSNKQGKNILFNFKKNMKLELIAHLFNAKISEEVWIWGLKFFLNFLEKPNKLDVLLLSFILPGNFQRKKEAIEQDIRIFEENFASIQSQTKRVSEQLQDPFAKAYIQKMQTTIDETCKQIVSSKQRVSSALQKNAEMVYIDEMPEDISKRIEDYQEKVLKKYSTKKVKNFIHRNQWSELARTLRQCILNLPLKQFDQKAIPFNFGLQFHLTTMIMERSSQS